MSVKMFTIVITILMVAISTSLGISWNGNNWALGCDFWGNDLTNAKTRGEDCGSRCASAPGCTHFTWTDYNGGTCWMKQNQVSKNDAFDSNDKSAVCGVVNNNGQTTGQLLSSILATRHGAYESGACALPKLNYVNVYPVALGDIAALGNLKFRPELCGHVLTADCDHGTLDIIINNSNLGGGLDLYASTWDKLTNYLPPGQTKCSVKLSSRNPMSVAVYSCYYKPGTDYGNIYYHNVGLLNTNEKIVIGAKIGNKVGAHRGANPYFAFDGEVKDSDQVTFNMDDGSTKSISIGDCIYLKDEQMWS